VDADKVAWWGRQYGPCVDAITVAWVGQTGVRDVRGTDTVADGQTSMARVWYEYGGRWSKREDLGRVWKE
jgi:hypothetical protein